MLSIARRSLRRCKLAMNGRAWYVGAHEKWQIPAYSRMGERNEVSLRGRVEVSRRRCWVRHLAVGGQGMTIE